MAEWHVPPDYILNNWSTEMLTLMTNKLVDRKQRMTIPVQETAIAKVTDDELFQKAGVKVKKVKREH